MGTISVIEATVDTTISTSKYDSDFVEVAKTEDLVEGKVYHVICSGITSTTDTGQLFYWQLYDETNSEVVDGSALIRKSAQSGAGQSYYFVGRITAGATTGGLVFQQKGYDESSLEGYLPASTAFLSMLLLDMSDMDAADYFYVNDDSQQYDAAAWATKVEYTETVIEENDEWLVFAGIETSINSLTRSPQARLNFAGTVASRAPAIKFEGAHTDERLVWWMCRSFPLNTDDVGGSVTWALQARAGIGTGINSYTQNATLFGIKVSSLADSFIAYTGGEISPTDAEFVELDTNTFTPTTTGKVIVAATTIFDAGGENYTAGQRIQRKVTTIPNDVPNTINFLNTNDAGDALPLSYITAYDGITGASDIMAYDVRVGTYYSGMSFDQSTLAIFGTTTVYQPIIFGAVENQVFVAGQQAGETFSAGQQAGEITG